MRARALFTGLLALLAPLLLAAQNERIRSFDSYITVNADGSMVVRETIEVQAAVPEGIVGYSGVNPEPNQKDPPSIPRVGFVEDWPNWLRSWQAANQQSRGCGFSPHT